MNVPTASTHLNFGEWLQVQRRRRELNQEHLAEALRVTTQTISNWETSHRPPKLLPQQTQQLCSLLGCSLEDLALIAKQTEEQSC